MTVVGLDLSLTSTGLAIIQDGTVTTNRIRSTGKKGDDLVARAGRLRELVGQIDQALPRVRIDLLVIEAPAQSKTTGHQHDRSGLWWMVVDWWLSLGPVATVTPGGRAKYATGKGNAGKDDVLAAVVRRYPAVDVRGNDMADALVLAAMGARHLGHPIEESLPQVNLAAMDGAAWPA